MQQGNNIYLMSNGLLKLSGTPLSALAGVQNVNNAGTILELPAPSPPPPSPPPPSPSPPPPQPSSPSPPPPPSPSPPPSPCACDTVSVALTGAAYGAQSSRAGQYTKMSATQGGRSVYAHAFRTEYLYFWADYSNWHVGPDYTSTMAGLMSTSDGNTLCPEDEGDSWQYWDGSSFQSGGVQVQCTGPSPPPLPPPPPPPPPPLPSPPPICYTTSAGTATSSCSYSSSTYNGVTTVTCSPPGCQK